MFSPEEIQKAIDKLTASAVTVNAEVMARMLSDYLGILGNIFGTLTKGEKLSWAQINNYGRMKKYMNEFRSVSNQHYSDVLRNIKDTRELAYVESYMKEAFNLEIQANKEMGFRAPSRQTIDEVLDNRIEKMKLPRVLAKHREEITKGIQVELTVGVQNGDSFEQIAERISRRVDISKQKAQVVTRTEVGRARSISQEKVFKQANRVTKVNKWWLATLDHRTRHSHRDLDAQRADTEGYFHIRGHKAKAPRLFGVPGEDINCRCSVVFAISSNRRARNYDDLDYQKKLAKRIEELIEEGMTDIQAENRAQKEIQAPNKVVKWQSYHEWYEGMLNKERYIFHTHADPIREVMGSMNESHPTEVLEMMAELREIGVEIIFDTRSSMSYQPGSPGKPGRIAMDKNASFSAFIHEFTHAMDDYKNGWTGARDIWDRDKRWAMEERAYNKEIEFARLNNLDKSYIIRLEALKERERLAIYKED